MIKQSGFQPATLTVPECVSDEDDHSDGMTPFSNIPSVKEEEERNEREEEEYAWNVEFEFELDCLLASSVAVTSANRVAVFMA
jgi:hypothetical protein